MNKFHIFHSRSVLNRRNLIKAIILHDKLNYFFNINTWYLADDVYYQDTLKPTLEYAISTALIGSEHEGGLKKYQIIWKNFRE